MSVAWDWSSKAVH